jgi:hypothetical protein
MATTISILGGVGLFLLGMTVMTMASRGLPGPHYAPCLARRLQHRFAAPSGAQSLHFSCSLPARRQ